MTTDETILAAPFETRAEQMLSCVFGGMHHVYSLKKTPGPYPFWTCIHHGDFSTFDFDVLTKLVLAAHHYCVRASISNGGPRAVKIMLHPRKNRDGGFSERHPTMQQAIERFRP